MQFREVLALLALATTQAFKTQSQGIVARDQDAGNPIRKVVTMMEKLAKKIEEEGKSEEDLYEKFECYCRRTTTELEQSISMAVTSPITQADIDSRKAEVDTLEAEVKKLKEDRLAEEETLKAAEGQRGKEKAQYTEEKTEDSEVLDSITKASQTLKGGAAFLQTANARMLRAIQQTPRLDASEKRQITSLLSGEAVKMDPDYVMGILSGMKEDTTEKISAASKVEADAVENFGELEASKKTEISSLLEQLERKMRRVGELKVEIVEMERSMAGAGQSLEEDKKMLAELKHSCAEKASAWEGRQKARSTELLALQETVKILDTDESHDLFRGRSASLIQVAANKDSLRERVLTLLSRAKVNDSARAPELNFLALALSGKRVDFGKIVEKIDGMVDLLKAEQQDDAGKKAYCTKQFHATELKNRSLQQEIASLTASVAQKADAVTQLVGEVKALQAGVAALDKTVAEAGENRKAEHAEFQELISSDSSALQLLGLAKQRLNQVYHASLVAVSSKSTSFEFLQMDRFGAPPPTFEGDYQAKAQESHGVISLMNTLEGDIKQEMALAKSEEANSQKEYEETLGDAASKREADLSLAAEKAKNKADLEVDLEEDKTESAGKKKEATATKEFAMNLHKECDWLLENFDLRKQARGDEKENLIRAKTVLSGM
ncbi:unnamed protein product [Effrenium voratum]|uniref:Myosin heavy chain n=1 Tax=Effrenium voratum TaxID=2562239 RepID=A0AA36MXL5_9DINO|nr:unnamed protein product [Effrenium voratum]CAJ1424802.1 unnamed protein product [Effrenium voratum]